MFDIHLRWSFDLNLLVLAPGIRPLGLGGGGLVAFALALCLCMSAVGYGDVGDTLDISYDAVSARWSSITTLLQGTANLAGHDEGFFTAEKHTAEGTVNSLFYVKRPLGWVRSLSEVSTLRTGWLICFGDLRGRCICLFVGRDETGGF